MQRAIPAEVPREPDVVAVEVAAELDEPLGMPFAAGQAVS